MTQDHEEHQARAVSDGRVHHCCSQEGPVGAAPLESVHGPFENRSETNQEGSTTYTANNCCNQNGSDGFGEPMATVAGQSAQTQTQEKVMDILTEAKLTCQERGKDYGHPYDDFNRVAKLWDVLFEGNSTMTGHACINPEQVAIAMILLKIARICQSPSFDHRDSRLDLIGYALCLDEVIEERNKVNHYQAQNDCPF